MNWYAKAIGLPNFYLTDGQKTKSGSCIQNTASDAIYICVMGARARALNLIKERQKDKRDIADNVLLPTLTAYFSREAHSSTEKAINMAFLNKRVVPVAEDGRMRADILKDMISKDMADGFTPCLVVATLGSTSACIMDDLLEIGPVCKEVQTIWFHVDAAYAGSALMLPEKRHLGAGLEFSDSFNTNAYKFMLVNCDCAAMWVKDIKVLKNALAIDPLYLKHVYEGKVLEYRNYGIALTRRFRALKLWMVFRCYGVSGLQKYMRNHCTLAKKFEAMVATNKDYILWNKVQLGLVCFRLA
jgi:tyrosine decarboxylase